MRPDPSPNDFRNSYPKFLRELDTDHGKSEFAARAYQAARSYQVISTIPSPEDREDIIQRVLVLCLDHDAKNLRRYEDRGKPFEAYFRVIVRACVYDHHRGKRTKAGHLVSISPEDLSALLEIGGLIDELPLDDEILRLIRREVAALDEPDRELVDQRFFQGMTPRQIAQKRRDLTNVQVSERIRHLVKQKLGPPIRRALVQGHSS